MIELLYKIFDTFFLAIVVYCICYVLVLFAIAGDLWSGVRKAKAAGKARTSYGFRQTVNKIAKYYNGLFSASIIDGFLMIVVYVMQIKGNWISVPLFPVVTIAIGAYLAFTEVRSVFEKLEDKEKSRMSSDVKVLAEIIKDDEKLDKVLSLIEKVNFKKVDEYGESQLNNYD